MPRYSDDELDELKRRTDLAALARSRGVELKAHGNGHLAGKCPFHKDDTPSFIVTPSKGLFHCLGCGAAGNAIQFLMKKDGVSFRHAVELLRTQSAAIFTAAPKTVPKLPPPVSFDADDQALLRQVLGYYHERLKQTPAALDYLKHRGLHHPEALTTFHLGFADRTLGLRLPQKNRVAGATIRERLERLGLYRESGHEHFNGCVVFPIPALPGSPAEALSLSNGAKAGPESWPVIGGVYGRKIVEKQSSGLPKHLYLPGPHRGVWNVAALAPQALSLSKGEVILCEALIDALTFWCAGFRHVTAAYGVEGFTQEIEDALVAAKVERVLIAFDRDEAGDRGAVKVAEKLEARGVECVRVQFPPGQDANEYARKVTPPDKSLGLLLRSAVAMDDMSRGPRRSFSSDLAAKSLAAPPPPVTTEPVVPATPDEAALAADLSAEASAKAEALAKADSLAAVAAKAASASAEATADRPEPAAKEEKSSVASVSASVISVVKNESDEIILAIGDREYRVRGLGKNTGFESLRVSLRVACGDRWHLDTLDLCSARQRDGFIAAAAAETLLKPDLLKRDLGKVLLKLEELQEERLKAKNEPKKNEPALSAEEREAALHLLRDPKLLDRILLDFAACGVVGEETNKLVGYLAAVSRKLDQPLAVIIQSTSAAGKTALMEAVLAFVPSEERVKYSALTGQALYYLSDADLRHKILAIVEEEGAERASYALKLLQSEGELTIASTGKDPHTGRMVTQEYRVEGPVMIFLTTTAVDIDEELLNRCLVLTVDEGREQTAAIHRLQRERETLTGLLRQETRSQVLATHRAAQRLLRPLAVVNPFAEQLTFLDDRTRTRRDHTKYLALIRCVALLHQYQRPVKTVVTSDGQTLAYIEATIEDVAAANRLAHEVLGRSLDEMPPQTRRLLDLLDRKVSAECAARKIERGDCLFSRRDVRGFTNWSDTQLRVHLDRLVELEYLLPQRGGRGQSFVYELVYDGGGKDGGRFLPGLLDVEKLREQSDRNPDASGLGADAPTTPTSRGLEAGSRGQNGANAGGSRPGENGDSSSEKAPVPQKLRGNAHLDRAGDHAAA